MSARKLWATGSAAHGTGYVKWPSKVAAYRYVSHACAVWLAGQWRSQHLTVYVDERDGQGWQRYEDVDLAEWGLS